MLLESKALLFNNLFPYKSCYSFKISYCHELMMGASNLAILIYF